MLHGDVHPGNCLLRDDGRVVLLDFGNARAIDAAIAVDPARAGIPQFYDPQMAETVLAGRLPPAATPASEQYAICVLAYVLVTGLQPVDSPAIHDELLRRIVQRPPLPFAARGVSSWPDVEAILGRGLAKTPGDRFPDVASLARAFLAARVPPLAPPPLPRAAHRAFDTAVETVRSLAASTDPLKHAWFALRAAQVLQDAELLAAADVLASRAGSGWAAQSVGALVARARSDVRMEQGAFAAFLASAQRLPDGPVASAAVVAAATMLDGAPPRSADAVALADWASRTVDRIILATPPPGRDAGHVDPLPTYAALLLARTGAVAARSDLEMRLEALVETRSGKCGSGRWRQTLLPTIVSGILRWLHGFRTDRFSGRWL